MKKQTIQKISAVLVPAALLFSLVTPVFAEDSTVRTATGNTTTGIKAPVKTGAMARAAQEIKQREDDLSALLTRIQDMAHVSDTVKTNISASVQSTISSLNALQTKIENDTDKTVLKEDMKAITENTRVYMLVAPQARILAAADRVNTVADMITAMNAKLQTRITAAEAAGKDMTTITSSESDITAKLADAKTQATAAINAVSGLVPDNGDAAKIKTNQASLKTARTAIATAEKDLNAAQKDVKMITKTLKTVHPNNGEGDKNKNEGEKDKNSEGNANSQGDANKAPEGNTGNTNQ